MPALGLGPSLTKPEAGGWTPRRVANLEVFAWFKAGNCFSSAYPTETVAGVGDSVQWVKPLYGTTNYLAETTNPPTLRADGLEFDVASTQRLGFASPASLGDMTIYAVIDRPTGAEDVVFAADGAGGSFLLYNGGGALLWQDDSGAATSAGMGTTDAVGPLWRFGIDSATSIEGESTGVVGGSAGLVTSFIFDEIGYSSVQAAGTHVNVRWRFFMLVKRLIALGSAEDLKIRNWILSNLSAELYGNSFVGPGGERFYQPGGIYYFIQ